MKKIILAACLLALFLTGCSSTGNTDSQLPWGRPAKWEYEGTITPDRDKLDWGRHRPRRHDPVKDESDESMNR